MHMKKIVSGIMVAAACVLCLSSCHDWLEASSSTQIQQDKLLSSREGFQDALTGVYVNMGSSSLYGGYITWQYADIVCYPYNAFSSATMNAWQEHAYSKAVIQSTIESVWAKAYNVIANINSILPYLEDRKNLFTSELEYNLVKGELLGLRAYLHFDLMRLYGTGGWSDANDAKMTVPYVTELSKNVTPQRSYKETRALLLSDLEAAIECLRNDPVSGVIPDGWDQGPNSEGYWNKRTTHFNLYAARMLEARVYQWMGDTAKAAELAQGIIDDAMAAGAVKWIDAENQVTILSNDGKDWTCTVEQIFQLDITGLYTNVLSLLMSGSSISSEAFHINADFITTVLYPVSGSSLAGAEDIRGTAMMLKYNSQAYDCYKLYGSSSMLSAYRNKMPMMKLPELYFMIAEDYLEKGNDVKVRETLDIIRTHRGIQSNLDNTVNAKDEFYREIMREFLNEGQMIYWFKRKGLDNYPGKDYFTVKVSDLTFPYPQEEINYGRKQEL